MSGLVFDRLFDFRDSFLPAYEEADVWLLVSRRDLPALGLSEADAVSSDTAGALFDASAEPFTQATSEASPQTAPTIFAVYTPMMAEDAVIDDGSSPLFTADTDRFATMTTEEVRDYLVAAQDTQYADAMVDDPSPLPLDAYALFDI